MSLVSFSLRFGEGAWTLADGVPTHQLSENQDNTKDMMSLSYMAGDKCESSSQYAEICM